MIEVTKKSYVDKKIQKINIHQKLNLGANYLSDELVNVLKNSKEFTAHFLFDGSRRYIFQFLPIDNQMFFMANLENRFTVLDVGNSLVNINMNMTEIEKLYLEDITVIY